MKQLILAVMALSLNVVFADAVMINTSTFAGTVGGEVTASSESYETETQVTFTAPETDGNGNAFVRWVGDLVDESTKTTNPLTLTISTGGTLRPVYANMWLLTKNSDTATVGQIADMADNWIFSVGEIDSENFTFWNGGTDGASSYKQGAGDIDLSTPICDEAGNQWSAVGVMEYAFKTSNKITSFIAPTTWVTLSKYGICAMGDNSVTNIVLNCPEAIGALPEEFFSSNRETSNMVFKLPKITSLPESIFAGINSRSRLGDSNVSEWNFDGLKNVAGGVFAWMNFFGDFCLPSIETIGSQAFAGDVNIKSFTLGTRNGALKSIGEKAFRKCTGLEKLVVMGAKEGWSVGSEAFIDIENLTEIVILSAPPTNLNATVFSWVSEEEKTIGLFVLESETNQWDSIVSLVQPVDANDSALAAYKESHPNCGTILGIIPAGVFSTKPQFFGIVEKLSDYGAGISVSYSVESANSADTVDAPDTTKLYDYGDEVTFTANLAEGSAFLKWEGCRKVLSRMKLLH